MSTNCSQRCVDQPHHTVRNNVANKYIKLLKTTGASFIDAKLQGAVFAVYELLRPGLVFVSI